MDSAKVAAVPGKLVNLVATVAPNARAAAEIYPAVYWFRLLKVPAASRFPGGKHGIVSGCDAILWLSIKITAALYDLLPAPGSAHTSGRRARTTAAQPGRTF